jgi:uncharacterized protein (TIGR03435 family)
MSHISRNPGSRIRNFAIGFVTFSGLVLFPLRSQAQTASPQATKPTFEVASVRLSPPNEGYTSISTTYPTNRFTAKNATLKLLIAVAFGVDGNNMSGGPDWLDSLYCDITAKSGDAGLSREQMQPLLQQLLEQRFHLTTHREKKDVSGYALVVAKGGAKLQANKGAPQLGYIFSNEIRIQNSPVRTLASTLAGPTRRPVVDRTGIEGVYDFDLKYASENAPSNSADSNLPDIFTAVQEQLGLKLEPQQVPVEILVIDHVDRTPTEN